MHLLSISSIYPFFAPPRCGQDEGKSTVARTANAAKKGGGAPVFEHDLDADKEDGARAEQEDPACCHVRVVSIRAVSCEVRGRRHTFPVPEHNAPELFAAVDADDEADEVGCHQQEDVGHSADCSHVSVPRPGRVLCAGEESVFRRRLQETARAQLTLEAGTSDRAAISGTTKSVIPQPHTSNLNLKSCHSATNVNTPRVARSGRAEPPRGMYRYRTIQRL